MKLKDLIKLAKKQSYDYKNVEVEDLLYPPYQKHGIYLVNIASGDIKDKNGTCLGYIEYTTKLSKLPSIGEVILMHDEYVGYVKNIKFDSVVYDASIWIDTAYILKDITDDKNLLKYPTFNAGTQI